MGNASVNKYNCHVAFFRTITQDHPSFVRANFSFAEIFATELPITRQDRDYAKSLLMKSLEGNPTSSKIHHKMGLFLIKVKIMFICYVPTFTKYMCIIII